MNWNVVHYPTYWLGSTTGEFKRTELAYPHVPKGHPVFAQSMVIGNLVFVSGCTGQDTVNGTPTPDTIDGQMANGLNGAKAALETAGSSMERIVKTFILARNASDYARIREIELEFYRRHAPALAANPPPSTLIVVQSLAKPEFLFEFEVIATLSEDMPDWQRQRHEGSDVVGNFAIVAGCQPTGDGGKVVAGDFDSQAGAVLDRLRQRMEGAGSRLDNLVKTHVFVKDLADIERYRTLEQSYFSRHATRLATQPPASTAIVVQDLSVQGASLEVDAFGVCAANDPNWPIEVVPGGSAAASVSAGRLVFLSGIDGSDPATGRIESDDIERQIIAALGKVKAAMEAAGSSLDKVLRTLMMLRRLDDYATMRSTEVTYYEKHAPSLVAKPPASTFLQLPAITRPEALFQIDVIGWR